MSHSRHLVRLAPRSAVLVATIFLVLVISVRPAMAGRTLEAEVGLIAIFGLWATGAGAIGTAIGTGLYFWRGTISADVFRLWYATNRHTEVGEFTNDFSEKLTYGYCDVSLPRIRRLGSVGSGGIRRFFQRAKYGADDSLKILIRKTTIGFPIELSYGVNVNDVLIYVHGYNTTFDDALIRAAQLGFDLKIAGATIAFCWPSAGSLRSYAADGEAISLTVKVFAEFLAEVKRELPDSQFSIIAHSMGNRALAGVLDNIDKYPALQEFRFRHIVLSAPDIDARYFHQISDAYVKASDRTTLYVCQKDRALFASEIIYEHPRLGYCPPLTVLENIDTVDVSSANVDGIGHGGYAEVESILKDIALVLDGMPAIRRPGLLPSNNSEGLTYWSMQEALR